MSLVVSVGAAYTERSASGSVAIRWAARAPFTDWALQSFGSRISQKCAKKYFTRWARLGGSKISPNSRLACSYCHGSKFGGTIYSAMGLSKMLVQIVASCVA
jgi:hypothetical protein